MNFNDNQPIYLQIIDWICDRVLRREWPADERIPSVRELGATLEVNPNTVMRAYERLQFEGVIYNRRGIGYFVCAVALDKIHERMRLDFMNNELPRIFDRMDLLSITLDQLTDAYRAYKSERFVVLEPDEK